MLQIWPASLHDSRVNPRGMKLLNQLSDQCVWHDSGTLFSLEAAGYVRGARVGRKRVRLVLVVLLVIVLHGRVVPVALVGRLGVFGPS